MRATILSTRRRDRAAFVCRFTTAQPAGHSCQRAGFERVPAAGGVFFN